MRCDGHWRGSGRQGRFDSSREGGIQSNLHRAREIHGAMRRRVSGLVGSRSAVRAGTAHGGTGPIGDSNLEAARNCEDARWLLGALHSFRVAG